VHLSLNYISVYRFRGCKALNRNSALPASLADCIGQFKPISRIPTPLTTAARLDQRGACFGFFFQAESSWFSPSQTPTPFRPGPKPTQRNVASTHTAAIKPLCSSAVHCQPFKIRRGMRGKIHRSADCPDSQSPVGNHFRRLTC